MGMMDKQIDKLAERAREFLGPEVNVRFALVGMGRNPYLAGAGLLGFLLGKWRGLVVTDDDVKLLACGSNLGPAKGFNAELATAPRGSDIGALTGMNAKLTFPNGEKIYVSRIHFDRLRAALEAA